jgi:hypothetical protein
MVCALKDGTKRFMVTCEELIGVDRVLGVVAYKVKLAMVKQYKLRLGKLGGK